MSESRGDADDAVGDADTGEAAASEASETPTGGRPCPLCDRPMYSRHCKYVCPEHGVVFDCADTFY